MPNPARDTQAVHLVGGLLTGLGIVQLLLTLVVAVTGLLTGAGNNFAGAGRAIAGVLLSVIMASTMSSCGLEFSRLRSYATSIHTVRLAWTAVLLLMVLCAIGGLWTTPILTTLAVLVILALLAVRGAIIRLS